MSSHEKADHWRLLAEEIGAEVPTEPEEIKAAPEVGSVEQAPEPVGPTAAAGGASASVRPVPVCRTASDWTRLAQELGVDVPPEPEPVPPPAAPGPLSSEEHEAETVPEPESEGGGAEVWKQSQRPQPVPERSAGGEERRGRRRRKKRRRPGEARGTEGARPEAGSGQSASQRPGEVPEALGTVAAAPVESATAESREESVRSRSKRRRRRRAAPADRPSHGLDQEVEPSAKEAGDRSAESVGTESQPTGPGELAADQAAGSQEQTRDHEPAPATPGSASEKALHRAIPSWKEAVNIVISANLEARAKNPDRRAGGRGRGGPDRRAREAANEKSG